MSGWRDPNRGRAERVQYARLCNALAQSVVAAAVGITAAHHSLARPCNRLPRPWRGCITCLPRTAEAARGRTTSMTRYGMTRRAALRAGVAGAAGSVLPLVNVHGQG